MNCSSRSKDKLEEAEFFLTQMQEQVENYVASESPKALQCFRYYTSAFVTAARSTTFVLQSQYRSIFGEEFDTWYKEQQIELSKLDSARLFLDLRNIVQKEGNRLPMIKLEVAHANDTKCYVTWDFTGYKEERIVMIEVIWGEKDRIKRSIPPGTTEEDFRQLVIQTLAEDTRQLFSKASLESAEVVSKSLVISEDRITVPFNEFIDMSREYVQVLERIIVEAERKFTRVTQVIP